MYIRSLILTISRKMSGSTDSHQTYQDRRARGRDHRKKTGPFRALWNGWRYCFDMRTPIGRAEFIWFFVVNTAIVSMSIDVVAIEVIDPGFIGKSQSGVAGISAAARHVTPDQIFLSRLMVTVGLCLLVIPLIGLFSRRMCDLGWRRITRLTVGATPLSYIALTIALETARNGHDNPAILEAQTALGYIFYGMLAALILWLSIRRGPVAEERAPR
jgi:uncharacterized membrane protein YhaH (DUF805 family)